MRRVNRSLGLLLLALAIGIVVAIMPGSFGGGGGASDDPSHAAAPFNPAPLPEGSSTLAAEPGPDSLSTSDEAAPSLAGDSPPTRLPRTVRILGPDGVPVPFARVGVLVPRLPAERPILGAMRFESFLDVQDGKFERLDPERPGTTYVVFHAAASQEGPARSSSPFEGGTRSRPVSSRREGNARTRGRRGGEGDTERAGGMDLAEVILGQVVDAQGRGVVARVALLRDGWRKVAAISLTSDRVSISMAPVSDEQGELVGPP